MWLMALLFKYLPVSKTKIWNDPQMGYELLFTSYILLVPEPTSLDVLINSDLDIKTRNNLIYECISGFFFRLNQTKIRRHTRDFACPRAMFVPSNSFRFEFWTLFKLHLYFVQRNISSVDMKKKVNIQALYYCWNQKCSVILFFLNRYTYIIKKLLITNHSQRYAWAMPLVPCQVNRQKSISAVID